MKRHEISRVLSAFKRAFSADKLMQLGRATRFIQRERKLTPLKRVMSVLSCFGGGHGTALADIVRSYNGLSHEPMAYKPFHNQLAKPAFAEFMREVAGHVLSQLVVAVLRPARTGLLSEFGRVLLQDGSSFAVHAGLRKEYPGRFTSVSPAAVELHVTWDLCRECIEQVILTPDTFAERAELPAVEELAGDLLLADRGYFDRRYLQALDAQGGRFVVRAAKNITPVIESVNSGVCGSRVVGRKLQDVRGRLSKHRANDVQVQWSMAGETFRCRLIAVWNPQTRQFIHLVTNLSPQRYDAEAVSTLYRLRWQIEILFKEWKSYANLRAFATRKDSIVEGLIWGAVIVAAVKRYLAHSTQIVMAVATSTLRTARCAWQVIPAIVMSLVSGECKQLRVAFRRAIEYLAINARRAHPKRDQAKGRLAIGLRPVFQVA